MEQCQAQQHSRRLRAPGKIRVERGGRAARASVSGLEAFPPTLSSPGFFLTGKARTISSGTIN